MSSRTETILTKILNDDYSFDEPQSRIENLLIQLGEKIESITGNNLFDINGEIDVNYEGTKQNLNSVTDGALTCNANSYANHAVGQLIETEIGEVYVFSGTVVSFGTSDSSVVCFYKYGTTDDEDDHFITELGDFSFTYTALASKTLFGFATDNGTGAQFTNIKVRKV